MQLAPNALYHIYNRGNNRQPIFFNDRNYDFFINKAYTELKSEIDFLAYCLMPNHFHLLVYTKPTCNAKEFSNGMRTLLSSYTRAIQKQKQITGSLFQQNTKCKELISNEYSLACFHYIHQNPVRAKLVTKLENWPHHSFFNEYYTENQEFCNLYLGRKLIQIPTERELFYNESYRVISDELSSELF